MEECFSSVVDVLVNDSGLVGSAKKFGVKLKIQEARLDQIMKTYKMGVIPPYELMHEFLKEWVQITGEVATVAELQRILEANCKLSVIAELHPGPIPSPDASTSAKCKIDQFASISQSSPIIEPFGFANVVNNFTGRDEELNTLTEHFHADDCPIVLLTGMGGIGKTQLATKFALDITATLELNSSYIPKKRNFQTAAMNSQIVKSWLAGENSQTLNKSISKFSKHLSIPLKDSEDKPLKMEKLLKKVMKKLKATVVVYKWLVVIDNVDEMYDEFKTVVKMLCKLGTKVFILVTTRSRGIFPGETEHFPLLQLKTSESILFVKKSLKINDNSSDESIPELCEQLGNFPLALGQAVAYIKQQQTISLKGSSYSVEDYLIELNEQDTLGLDKACELSEYPWSTMKVWNITFDKIKNSSGNRGSQTLKLLDIISFLDPDHIIIYELEEVFAVFYDTEDSEDVEKCLGVLLNYSLINIHAEFRRAVTVHRLVQLAIRKRMHLDSPSKEEELLTNFWTNFQPTFGIRQTPNFALHIWKYSTNFHNLDRIRASMVHRLVDEILSCPPRGDCYKLAVEGCELLLRLFRDESVQYLTMQRRLFRLMIVRQETNDSFLEKLLSLNAKLTELVGETHMETLSAGYCVSEILNGLGKREESFEWCQRLRNCFSRIIGQEDKAIIDIKNKVANSFGFMGRAKEAVEMLEEILEWTKLNSDKCSDLELVYLKMYVVQCLFMDGRCSEAKVKFRELISSAEHSGDRMFVLYIKCDVADGMEKSGQFQDALDLMHEVSEEFETSKAEPNGYAVEVQEMVSEFRRKLADAYSGSLKNTGIAS